MDANEKAVIAVEAVKNMEADGMDNDDIAGRIAPLMEPADHSRARTLLSAWIAATAALVDDPTMAEIRRVMAQRKDTMIQLGEAGDDV